LPNLAIKHKLLLSKTFELLSNMMLRDILSEAIKSDFYENKALFLQHFVAPTRPQSLTITTEGFTDLAMMTMPWLLWFDFRLKSIFTTVPVASNYDAPFKSGKITK